MKTRPILFNTDMVKAIIDGRKTQTRRIIDKNDKTLHDPRTTSVDLTDNKSMAHFRWKGLSIHYCGMPSKFKIGDVMWVRETWKPGAWRDDEFKAAFDYKASPELVNTPWCHFQDIQKFEYLHAKWFEELQDSGIEPSEINEEEERVYYKWEPGKSPLSWKPSIHMPKEACRLFLKVTNVRVERLQDIYAKDAISEGILYYDCEITQTREFKDYLTTADGYGHPDHDYPSVKSARESFFSLWESINGKESLGANPWVWVYDFEITERPENFLKAD